MSNISPGDLIGPLYVLGVLPRKKKTTNPEGFAWDNFVLTQEQFDAKAVTLSETPADPLKVVLVPQYGIEQKSGVDFVVQGNELSWDGLALDLLLSVEDTFAVRYIPIS